MAHKKKPKIALLTILNTYNYGGVLSCLKVAHQFCQKYFDTTVFSLGFDKEISTSIKTLKFTSSARPISYFGMNYIEIGARWAFWEPGHYTFTLPYWKKLLKEYDYFFVVSGTCIAAHPLVQLEKKFTMWIGTPYDEDRSERVKQLRGIRAVINKLAHSKMKAIEKKILQKSDFTWAISSYAKNQFQQIIGKPKKNIRLCGFPINTSKATQTITEKEKIIIAVGRFSDPRKNIGMLLRVFNKLHHHIPELKLYVIGMKPSNELLFSYSHLPSFENIIFTGQISKEDLNSLYKRASLMLMTSHQEGLGIVGLEALFHGTPVIATNCGGTSDYTINDVTGYLVDINDDETMVKKSLEVLSSPKLFKQLSENGKKLIEKNFSVPKITEFFKFGLSTTYPNLKEWFAICDKASRKNKKIRTKSKTKKIISTQTHSFL